VKYADLRRRQPQNFGYFGKFIQDSGLKSRDRSRVSPTEVIHINYFTKAKYISGTSVVRLSPRVNKPAGTLHCDGFQIPVLMPAS
jgi:hypothetical protein